MTRDAKRMMERAAEEFAARLFWETGTGRHSLKLRVVTARGTQFVLPVAHALGRGSSHQVPNAVAQLRREIRRM